MGLFAVAFLYICGKMYLVTVLGEGFYEEGLS